MARWFSIGLAVLALGLAGCGSSDEDDGGGGGNGAGGGDETAACFAMPWLTPSCIACRQQNCDALMTTAFGAEWMTVGSLSGLCGMVYDCQCQCVEGDAACINGCLAFLDNTCIDAYAAANVCGQDPCGEDCSM